MSIQGKCIAVTRTAHQQAEFLRALQARGAIPFSYPCIDIGLPSDTTALDLALNTLKHQKNVWLVLSSQNSVRSLKARARELGLSADALSHVRVAAVGQKTLEAVQQAFQMQASLVPRHFGQNELLPMLGALKDQHVVLLQGNLSDNMLYNALLSHTAKVLRVLAYVTKRTRPAEALAEKLLAKTVRAITFTCPSSVRACFENLAEEDYAWTDGLSARIACIGESTANEVKRLGLEADVVASTHTLDGLIDALEEYYAHRSCQR